MKHGVTKQKIVEAADGLFYRQGFECTSFTDIASAVGISRGNLHHHFKIKDDILDAVIEARLGQTKKILDQWEAEGKSPSGCLEMYFKSLVVNWSSVKDYGCPFGTMCNELAKLDHPARKASTKAFELYRQWIKRQFVALSSVEDPDVLAMDMLAWGQGVASVGNAYKDLRYVKREVEKMCGWLQALPVKDA